MSLCRFCGRPVEPTTSPITDAHFQCVVYSLHLRRERARFLGVLAAGVERHDPSSAMDEWLAPER